MTAHARNAPSSAYRWMRCHGSLNFIDENHADDDADGVAAHEGTILHAICEDALRKGRDAWDYVGQTWTDHKSGHSLLFTEDLAEMAQQGIDLIDSIPGDIHIEKRLDLSRWMPDQFGTLDVGIVSRKRVVIFDWKWGMVPVSPVNNEQLMTYALGFWDKFVRKRFPDLTDFTLIIWQPRALGGGGEWNVKLDELLSFGKKLKIAAEATRDPLAKRTPGDLQCRYCPGAKNRTCKEYVEFVMSMFIDDYEDVEDNVEHGLPPRLKRHVDAETRGWILKHRSMIERFLEHLYQEALNDAIVGRPTPGHKLGYGRPGTRQWVEAKPLEFLMDEVLGEKAFKKKAVSPAEAEKIIGKSRFERIFADYISRNPAKMVLVSDEDLRPAAESLLDIFGK